MGAAIVASGRRGGTRTRNLQIRSLAIYPVDRTRRDGDMHDQPALCQVHKSDLKKSALDALELTSQSVIIGAWSSARNLPAILTSLASLSVGEVSEAEPIPDSPAVKFARQGRLKGGQVRAATLTAERRHEIAVLAAKSRWGTKSE
jgi:hypothetical protein